MVDWLYLGIDVYIEHRISSIIDVGYIESVVAGVMPYGEMDIAGHWIEQELHVQKNKNDNQLRISA